MDVPASLCGYISFIYFGLRVSGFRVWGLGFKSCGFRVKGKGFRVEEFRDLGFGALRGYSYNYFRAQVYAMWLHGPSGCARGISMFSRVLGRTV